MALGDVAVYNVVIAGDVLNVSAGSGIYNVDTQGGTPTDNIAQITGHTHPNVYELRVHTAGHYWTLLHNVANGIRLMYGLDFATAHPDDAIILRTSDKGSYLIEFIPRVIIHNT
jgi:hypothetical protein